MPTFEVLRTVRPGSADEVKRIQSELSEDEELHRSNARMDHYNIVKVVPDPKPPHDLYDVWGFEKREATDEERAELAAAYRESSESWKALKAEAERIPQAVAEAVAASDAAALADLSNRKATIGFELLLAELQLQEAKVKHLFAHASWQRAEEARSRTKCYAPSVTTEKAAQEQREACARYHSLRGGAGQGIGDVRRRIEAIRAELGR